VIVIPETSRVRVFDGLYIWTRSKRMELVVFASMAGLYFFANFQRVGVPGTIFNEVQSEFAASASAVTALAAVFLYVYAGMQVFVGAGADRFGPAKMVLTGGAFLATGSILFPLCRTLPQVYACRAVVGLGASFMYISIIRQIVNTFEPRYFPPLLGMLLVVGYSGGLAATAPLALAVKGQGWREVFGAAGIACAVVYLVMLALVMRTGSTKSHRATFSLAAAKELVRKREIYPIMVTGAINFGIYYVLQMTVGKKFLEDFLGMSSGGAALVTGAMLLVVTVGYVAGGFLPKLAGERRKPFVITASAGVLAASLLLFLGVAAGMPPWWFAMAYVLLGATNSPAIVGTTLLKEVSPSATSAFSISLLNAACYVAVAAASTAAGLVLDAFKEGAREVGGHTVYPRAAYQAMFAGMAALALVSVFVSFFAPETRGVQREEEAAGEALRQGRKAPLREDN